MTAVMGAVSVAHDLVGSLGSGGPSPVLPPTGVPSPEQARFTLMTIRWVLPVLAAVVGVIDAGVIAANRFRMDRRSSRVGLQMLTGGSVGAVFYTGVGLVIAAAGWG